jgi:hypothetical protein
MTPDVIVCNSVCTALGSVTKYVTRNWTKKIGRTSFTIVLWAIYNESKGADRQGASLAQGNRIRARYVDRSSVIYLQVTKKDPTSSEV